MKAKIIAFMDSLISYDYILFGVAFGLFLLFIILTIVLKRKAIVVIIFGLLSFLILTLGSTFGYIKMHEYLFKNSLKLESQKRLEFTSAIIVKGTLSNESKFYFNSCKISAKVYKLSKNRLKNYIYQFKTLKTMSIIEENIGINQTINFKIIVEPFRYSKDYKVTLGASCK